MEATFRQEASEALLASLGYQANQHVHDAALMLHAALSGDNDDAMYAAWQALLRTMPKDGAAGSLEDLADKWAATGRDPSVNWTVANLRIMANQLLAAPPEPPEAIPKDGPGEQGKFHYQGNTATMEPTPWRLLKHVWEHGRDTLLDSAIEYAWGYGGADDRQVRTAATRANNALEEARIPFSLSVRKPRILLQ